MCSSSTASELVITWAEPIINADNVVDYVVGVLQYVQPEGTRELQLVNLSSPFNRQVDRLEVTVLEGVGK